MYSTVHPMLSYPLRDNPCHPLDEYMTRMVDYVQILHSPRINDYNRLDSQVDCTLTNSENSQPLL